jgi:hypothetical protein
MLAVNDRRKEQVDRSPEMGTVTDVFAQVTTGQLKGRTLNVTWVSKTLQTGYTQRGPEMLEPVPMHSLQHSLRNSSRMPSLKAKINRRDPGEIWFHSIRSEVTRVSMLWRASVSRRLPRLSTSHTVGMAKIP